MSKNWNWKWKWRGNRPHKLSSNRNHASEKGGTIKTTTYVSSMTTQRKFIANSS